MPLKMRYYIKSLGDLITIAKNCSSYEGLISEMTRRSCASVHVHPPHAQDRDGLGGQAKF